MSVMPITNSSISVSTIHTTPILTAKCICVPINSDAHFKLWVRLDLIRRNSCKSVNGAGKGKASDTMGMKHKVTSAMYVAKGSINHQLAQKTGFTDEDAEKIKEALRTLFVNDASAARPDGSMEVCKVYWWRHNCPMGQYSSAKVHRSLKISANTELPKCFEDYSITVEALDGLEPEVIEGV